MDEIEVKDAIESLERNVLDRVAAMEKNMGVIQARADEAASMALEVAKKAGRPTMAPDGSVRPDRKALDTAVRALLAGDQKEANRLFVEAKAMNAGTGPDGGYVVVDQFSTEMTQIVAEISPITRLARTIPMTSGDAFEEPVDKDTAEAQWVGEVQARTDTRTPQFAMFRADLAELCAQPKISQKLIDVAAIDIVAWLQGKVGEAFGVAESAAYHSGNGVSKPRGFLTYPTAATPDASRAWGTVQHVLSGVDGGFPTPSTSVNSADPLQDVISSLKVQYRTGANWLMNRKTAGEVSKLKDAYGRWVWVDSLVQGQPAMLLGYPVEISEDMPDVTTDALAIAFGNFRKAYTIIRYPGVKFLADPYTDKPNVRLYAFERVGGGVNNFEALKFLKFSD